MDKKWNKKYICPYQLWCNQINCLHSKPHRVPKDDRSMQNCTRVPCTLNDETIEMNSVCIEIKVEDGD